MMVGMGIGRFIYTPILPGMMQALGLSASDAGLIASANYLGYLIGAFVAAGRWAEGREHNVALGSLVASTVLTGTMAMTDSVAAFLAIRFLAGVASAFMMVFMSTIVFSRLARAGRSDLSAWHFSGVGGGMAISALVTGLLGYMAASWRADWLAGAVVSAIGVLIVYMLLDREPGASTRPVPEPNLSMTGAMGRITLAYGLFGFGYIVTATFLVAIVRQDGLGVEFESIVWIAAGLAGVPSVWLWGRMVGRWGLARVFAVGCVVEAIGVVASVTVGGYAGPLIGGVLLGGTFIAITAFGLQFGRQIAGASPRRALALMTAAFGVGQIIGPIAAGAIADRTGNFTAASLLASVVLLVAAFVAYGAGKRV